MPHTPGPWHIDQLATGNLRIRAVDQNDGLLCFVAAIYGDQIDSVVGNEVRANARLIAAAPDLLEAAKELLALMDAVPVFLRYEFEPLRSALKKAENCS